MSAAEILVVRELDKGIYASSGGGRPRVVSRHQSGPRGLTNAINALAENREDCVKSFGSIGAGAGWLEVVEAGGKPGTGIILPSFIDWSDMEPPVSSDYQWWKKEQKIWQQFAVQIDEWLRRDEQAYYDSLDQEV
jgi:hypothetical protein